MAVVGSLGDIVFTVSSRTVETLNNFKWSGSARFATHDRHATNALTEFTGVDPDVISFDMLISAYLGADPIQEVAKIFAYERAGKALPLTLGDKGYGKYRWTIKKHEMSAKTYAGDGSVTSATVAITLQEYLRS